MEVDGDGDGDNANRMEIGEVISVSAVDPQWKSFLEETGFAPTIVADLEKVSKRPLFLRQTRERKIGSLEGLMDEKYPNFTYEHAEKAVEILNSGSAESTADSNRGPSIADGLDTDLVHRFDLDAFTGRIDDLFKWHHKKDDCSKFLAPYFVLIQSSGMGKTKLFTEFRRAYNETPRQQCKTILCIDAKLGEQKEKKYFDHTLIVGEWKTNEIKDKVWAQMNQIVPEGSSENENVVLLFDEAQGLMKGVDVHNRSSYVFRAIRWWLRVERTANVVAAFAGTTAKLSNFFPPDPPEQGASRRAAHQYKNYKERDGSDNKKLYRPFFELNTISCLRLQKIKSPPTNDETQATDPGFPMAAIYGRPLFAYYYLQGTLDNAKLGEFAKRLVLSVTNYETNLTSCYSVLGARVQMGIVNSFHTSSELVSSGYACLVDFQQQQDNNAAPVARVTFMPDPVCATLAMRFMNENWEDGALKGEGRNFWVKQAQEAFTSKLCLPDKGDAGEVFAALYMLFCGDILRQRKDPTLSTFSVSLDAWFLRLKNGGIVPTGDKEQNRESKLAEGEQENLAKEVDAMFLSVITRLQAKRQEHIAQHMEKGEGTSTVSFVQVCRNDLRSNSFCEEASLKYMYHSGLGSYAYKNCKAFDIASSIRVVYNCKTCYHPLLVSVKNWTKVTKGDVVGWLSTMKAFLQDIREEGGARAVCLIILLGCSNPPDMSGDMLNSSSLKPFPGEDVFRLVGVPTDDKFGVSEAIRKLGTSSERSEIYSSHSFMPCEKSSASLLRKSSKLDRVSDLFDALKLTTKETTENMAKKARMGG